MPFIKRKILPIFKKIKSKLISFFGFVFSLGRKRKNSANQVDLDKKLVQSLSSSKIPNPKQLTYLKKFLSFKELWAIRFFSVLLLVNILILGFSFYRDNFETVPTFGGSYVEGVVGMPQYVNPLYNTVNDVDSDISSLVFSSLFKFDQEEGLKKDLVVDYSVSEDKKEFVFQIRDDVIWHNDQRLTAKDIVFTFDAVKDPAYDSPLRPEFAEVEVEALDEFTIKFTLDSKQSDFLNLLTFGILPENLWSQTTPQTAKLTDLNLKPIGSGPYEFKSLLRNRQGSILSYTLEANEDYYLGRPNIEEVCFKFFTNINSAIEALNRNEIDGLSYLPPGSEDNLIAKGSLNIHYPGLSQVNSLFFNQDINQSLENHEVRRALGHGIDKQGIISDILYPSGERTFSFLPSYFNDHNPEDIDVYDFDQEKAMSLLEEADWVEIEVDSHEIEELKKIEAEIEKRRLAEEENDRDDQGEDEDEEEAEEEEVPELNEEQRARLQIGPGTWRVMATSSRESEEIGIQDFLIMELTVPENQINELIAKEIKRYWEEIGVKTNLRKVSPQEMRSEVIDPSDFEVLLYAQFFNIKPDLRPFWHSSEIDQGLNITGYSNEEVDELLDELKDLDMDNSERFDKYKAIQKKIAQDLPAIPFYSPNYTYVQNNNIKGVDLKYITSPTDRFSDIRKWYIKTGKKLVW